MRDRWPTRWCAKVLRMAASSRLPTSAATPAVEQPPVSCDYRGWTLVAPSPPSSGGVVMCEILGILQAYPLGKEGRNSAAATHLQVEAERAAYLDRNTVLGDPDFVADPVAMLLSPTHLRQLRDRIQPVAATPSAALAPVPVGTAEEKPQTTSYSVVDGLGNAVAVTYTINGYFGAGVIARPHPASFSTTRWTTSLPRSARRTCSGWCRGSPTVSSLASGR